MSSSLAPTKMRVVLAGILFFTLLISYLDRVNVSVLAADPNFLNDMGIKGQPVMMGLLLTTFLYAYGLSNLVVGPIGDKLGPRKAMSIAIILWAIAIGVGGLAATFAIMVAARILLGIGEGLHWPMMSSYVKNWFPPAERSKANAAWLLGVMVGPMVSIPVISYIVGHYGWRESFLFLLILGLIPLVIIWFFAPDHPRESKFVNTAELAHIEAGLKAEEAAQAGAGVSGRSMAFLRDARFWLITLAFLSSASVFWGTVFWLPSYLKVARGFSWAQMGWLATLPYVLGAITVIVFGFISDKIERKSILPIIALLGAAASIYFGATAKDNTLSAIGLSLSIGFLGVGLATYWTMMQGIVSPASTATAAGVMNGVTSLGSAAVPAIVGALISNSGGNYTAGLLFLMGMAIFGGLCMIVLTLRRT